VDRKRGGGWAISFARSVPRPASQWNHYDQGSAITSADDAIRIESSATEPEKPVTQPRNERKAVPVSDPVTNPNGNAASNGNSQSNGHAKANGQTKVNSQARKPGQDIDSLIRQVEALRQAQRDAAAKTHELLKGRKRHRRQTRAFQNAIREGPGPVHRVPQGGESDSTEQAAQAD
jgi:hypothetical protein